MDSLDTLNNIYKSYIKQLDKEEVDKFLLSQKIGKRNLNALSNDKIRKSITTMIIALNPESMYSAAIVDEWGSFNDNCTIFRYQNYAPNNRKNGMRCKNCSFCKEKLKSNDVFICRSYLYDNTNIETCSNCMTTLTNYAEKQIVFLSKKIICNYLLLLKETDIYKQIDIDAFKYIFKLSIIVKNIY